MSSLWTPYGEEPVPPAGAGSPPSSGGTGGGPGGPPGWRPGRRMPPEDIDPEQMREMLTRLAETPVEAIVTQFAVELQEIAVLHLGLAAERPGVARPRPRSRSTRWARSSTRVGDRFGPNAEPLRQAVAALRLGYVEVSSQICQAGDSARLVSPAS